MFESTVNASSFRGFLIQARLAVDDTTVVGQFEEPPVGGDYRYGSCTNREVFMYIRSNIRSLILRYPTDSKANYCNTVYYLTLGTIYCRVQ